MHTSWRAREKAAVFLLVAQASLLVTVGLLAILAPTTLLFRAAWWGCIAVGAAATILGLVSYAASRKWPWLLFSGFSLLCLGAATPAHLWLIGL